MSTVCCDISQIRPQTRPKIQISQHTTFEAPAGVGEHRQVPAARCVLRYLPPGGESGLKTGNIAAHRTRILRISETRLACGACGVAGEGRAECDNTVNPARQGSGVRPGAAGAAVRQQAAKRRRAWACCGYAVGRPAAIQASVPPEMLWIVKL